MFIPVKKDLCSQTFTTLKPTCFSSSSFVSSSKLPTTSLCCSTFSSTFSSRLYLDSNCQHIIGIATILFTCSISSSSVSSSKLLTTTLYCSTFSSTFSSRLYLDSKCQHIINSATILFTCFISSSFSYSLPTFSFSLPTSSWSIPNLYSVPFSHLDKLANCTSTCKSTS